MDRAGWNQRDATTELLSLGDIAREIADSGLVVDRVDRVQRTATTPDGERTAIDVLVRVQRPGER